MTMSEETTVSERTGHAPGPWRIEHDKDGQANLYGSDGSYIGLCAHQCVTSLIPVMEANSHLVKAAPDLLAICEKILDHWYRSMAELREENVWDFSLTAGMVCDLNAAVARAIGKA